MNDAIADIDADDAVEPGKGVFAHVRRGPD